MAKLTPREKMAKMTELIRLSAEKTKNLIEVLGNSENPKTIEMVNLAKGENYAYENILYALKNDDFIFLRISAGK